MGLPIRSNGAERMALAKDVATPSGVWVPYTEAFAADMQVKIHAERVTFYGQNLADAFYPRNAYNFPGRLSRAAKKASTNWRMNQDAVDHSWERQDAIFLSARSKHRAENARRWVDESLRRATLGGSHG